jgi:hypothetical protein
MDARAAVELIEKQRTSLGAGLRYASWDARLDRILIQRTVFQGYGFWAQRMPTIDNLGTSKYANTNCLR